MADGMVKSQSFSADLLAVVSDAKGASKAIKAEMRSAEKEVKAAERELKKLEKEKAKALKGGGDVGAVDRKMAEQRALMQTSQRQVASLESKKKQQDSINDMMKMTEAKANNTIDKRFSRLRGDMMGVMSQIRAGRPDTAVLRTFGMGVARAGSYLEQAGFKRVGEAVSRQSASFMSTVGGASARIAAPVGAALAVWKVASDQNRLDKEAAQQERTVWESREKRVRAQAFSSGMSAQQMA